MIVPFENIRDGWIVLLYTLYLVIQVLVSFVFH